MEIKLPYSSQTAQLMSYEKAVEMIENITFDEAFELSWKGFFFGKKDGYAELNLDRGKYESNSLEDEEANQGVDAVAIVVYKIDKHPELGEEELLSDDERAEFRNYSGSIEQWMKLKGIDYMDRVKDYFIFWWDNASDYWERKAKEELEEWYSKEKVLS